MNMKASVPCSKREIICHIVIMKGVVNWNTREDVQLTCVAACLQRNTSAIVTLKDSGLDRPKLLDGKVWVITT